MSDTPETDAFYGELHPEQGLLEHARSLERRLQEAQRDARATINAAPQSSTATVCPAPSNEGVGQGGTASAAPDTPETDLHEFTAYTVDSTMRRLECSVVHASIARDLESRLRAAQREKAHTQQAIAAQTRVFRKDYHAMTAERDAALREVEELREALREEPGKWGWDVVMLVGRRVLDECYPADIFTGASGDLGPAYIVALRNALSALDAALAEKGKP